MPKKENFVSLDEFKPISLVECIYKVITKVLENKIKLVLSKTIDSSQSIFLKGKGLLDSTLVANEVVDEIKREKKSGIVVKVDYEKAYNSVDWNFLYHMMGS